MFARNRPARVATDCINRAVSFDEAIASFSALDGGCAFGRCGHGGQRGIHSARRPVHRACDREFRPDRGRNRKGHHGDRLNDPHAAGVAALLLQKAGGPDSITHSQLVSILESSVTMEHDLDPFFCEATAQQVNNPKRRRRFSGATVTLSGLGASLGIEAIKQREMFKVGFVFWALASLLSSPVPIWSSLSSICRDMPSRTPRHCWKMRSELKLPQLSRSANEFQ